MVEEKECKTLTETVCGDVQYETKLDSYGNPINTNTIGQDVDSYGAPLAPPVQQDIDGYGAPAAPVIQPDVGCREVPREVCRQVRRSVCVPVSRPKEDLVTREECREEPNTQCRQVTRARPQKKCVPVDVQKCRWIVRAFKVKKNHSDSKETNSLTGGGS